MSLLSIKKILNQAPNNLIHASVNLGDGFITTKRIEIGSSGNANGEIEYVGWALIGTAETQPKWFIIKLTYDSNINITEIKAASAEFDQIWSDRASLTYL